MVRGPSSWLVLAFLGACGGNDDRTGDAVDGGRNQNPGADARLIDPDGAPDRDGAPGETSKVVFVTSTTQSGALGGPDGADSLCAERAADASLDGTFKAWISAPGDSAADRLSHASVAYFRTDGVKVADGWGDLVNGDLDAPIDRTEDGDPEGGDVWTGTLANGNTAGDHCDGFTTTSSTGLCGDSGAQNGDWSNNLTPLCSSGLRLYCLEQ